MTQATIIDGKAIANQITDQLAVSVSDFNAAVGAPPCLAVVLVGDNPASAVYVRNKSKIAEKIGFRSIQKTLPETASEAELLQIIMELNNDDSVNAILVQLPLPKHVDEEKVLELVDPAKDVDGFHPINVGRLGVGNIDETLLPCTPHGCLRLAKSVRGEDLSGLHTVIVGRSNIVGKPAAQLFLSENCTVTMTHSRTKDIQSIARQADILIAAVGRAQMITGGWIKPGATVIDVGINRIDAPKKGPGKSRLVGDVDFESALAAAGAITPVPGGVGPMTIAMLMRNTYIAACRQKGVEPK
ncbi:MAG: bifunctional methylenetetrahydrofolate dehydrogenase/methenyltetrahydrofolate cyclohydrolase FolD [Pseudomonadota bacterium]